MAKFKPVRLKRSQVADYPIKNGQLIICTDSYGIFMDISDSERRECREIILTTSAERTEILTPVTGFYYETDTNKLWFYGSSGWVPATSTVDANTLVVTYTDAGSLSELQSGETLSTAFGKIKVAISNLISHLKNFNNPHKVTKAQVGLGNVENKTGATIRSELTKEEVVNALGYTPPEQDTNTIYGFATADVAGIVKSGGDVEVQDDGVMKVVDRAGKNVEGDSFRIGEEDIVAETGAEIFNDYDNNIATGEYSHAEGSGTIASGAHQHVQGKYNIADTADTYAAIVGNGEDNESRSNAHTLDWNGNAWYSGKVSAGTAGAPANPTAANDLVTKKYADDIKSSVTSTINSHTGNTSNPHKVTKAQIGLGNVENKSGATIRSEMTKDEVVKALGYTPPEKDTNTTYTAATTSKDGLMSAADKTKLDGIAAGANKYVHPSHTAKAAGLYKVAVDNEGHVSEATAVAKGDITALGIPAQDTTYGAASASNDGLMSSEDKAKLDGIAAGANKYTHPGYTQRSAGFYKVTVDATGHVSNVAAVAKGDITALGIPAQDTTYSPATGSANGLMSAADKKKLDGIAEGANKYTHPAHTSHASGLYKVTVDASGHVSAATAVTKTDITGLGIPAQDTKYSIATGSTAGLIKAKAKTTETGEVAIDSATGKLYAPVSTGYTRIFGGADLGGTPPSGTDANAQFSPKAINLGTSRVALASISIDDLPLGEYSIMIRLKLSAVSSGNKSLQLTVDGVDYYISPSMLSSANTYTTIGFLVSHTVKGNMTISFGTSSTTTSGVTGSLDYIMVTPAATAIYAAQ